jgi:hypothetical protein
MNPVDESAPAVALPRLVRLVQCGRRACGYVLTEEERDWREDPEWEGRKTAVCPKCGEDSFYSLNELGQKLTMRDRDKYRDGIDPATIEPSPRMGEKMKRWILAAKSRAIGTGKVESPEVTEAKRRLLKCLRHESPIKCCGEPMLHGGIELGEAPITACMICGKGLPPRIAFECGLLANDQGHGGRTVADNSPG